MDAQRVKQFVTLTRRKKAAEGELKAVKAELAILEEILRDEFASDDFQSVHQGGMTVYMHRQWWARLKKDAHEASIDSLRQDPEWRAFIHDTINVNSVSARVRELIQEVMDLHPDWSDDQLLAEGVPQSIRDGLCIEREYKIRARQG